MGKINFSILGLGISSLSFSFLIFFLEKTFIITFQSTHDIYLLTFTSLVTLSVIAIFVRIFSPLQKVQLQKVHNEPSWVFYCFWGLLVGILGARLLSFSGLIGFRILSEMTFSNISFSITLILAIYMLFELTEAKNINKEVWRFSSSAVGKDFDKLGFTDSAQNTQKGLLKLTNQVNVTALYGGLGQGKSSYTRMILENFNKEKTLYTYISLTEVNQATDFSNLFAERWIETLSSRYPLINYSIYLPQLNSILRESGNGFFSTILECLTKYSNFAFLKTFKKCPTTTNQNCKSDFVDNKIARIFANIREIKEDIWIIVIDEIERATLSEIYRTIEIIERFKNEGRTGLPVKVLFILCIARDELEDLLKTFGQDNTRAFLLERYFFIDPKSIDTIVLVPPVPLDKKRQYIIEKIKILIENQKLKTFINLEEIRPNMIADPKSKFLNHKESMEYVLGLLEKESPRVIERSIEEVKFFYNAFYDKEGNQQKNAIRTSDLIAISYIKIKYPYIIDFLKETIESFIRHNGFDLYFLRENTTDKKLTDWLSEVTKKDLNDNERKKAEEIIGLIAFYYIDFINKTDREKNKMDYENSLSYPERLFDYLSTVSGRSGTDFDKNYQLFNAHKKGKAFLKQLSNDDLIKYARFIGDIEPQETYTYDVFVNIFDRLMENKIKSKPKDIGDTELDEATYRLIFLLLNLIQQTERKRKKKKIVLDKAIKKMEALIKSPKINTGVKYIIFNSFLNDTRGGGSEIHSRLKLANKYISETYGNLMEELARYTFEQAEVRYFTGNKSIYDNEENFFYLLYQSWSGDPQDLGEIEKIRKAAERNLIDHPDAIALYWNAYPYDSEWQTYEDLNTNRLFDVKENRELYMPLEKLVEISQNEKVYRGFDKLLKAKIQFWKKVTSNKEYLKDAEIKKSDETLKGILIKKGILKAKTAGDDNSV